MVSKSLYRALLSCALVLGGTTGAIAATQTLSFSGTLQNGYNQTGGPFGPANTDLTGKAYSVTLSYDPSQFVTGDFSINSCGSAASTSCYFTFSTTRTLSETITVNGITTTFVSTAGGFTLNSSGNDRIDFSFQGTSGLSLSGAFADGNSFFPNQSNVNNPIFSNFTDMNLSQQGTFNQNTNTFSLGANPSKLTANYTTMSAAPEPAAWVVMVAGFGMIGAALRRRRSPVAFA